MMSAHLVSEAIGSRNFNCGREIEDNSLFLATVRPDTSMSTKPSLFHCLTHLYSVRCLGLRECFRGIFIAEASTVRLSVFFRELTNENGVILSKPIRVSNY